MNTYGLRFEGSLGNSKVVKAENIDNLRRNLIAEYKDGHKVHDIYVDVFRKGRGYVCIGKLNLDIYPMWTPAKKKNVLSIPNHVYKNTGKLKR